MGSGQGNTRQITGNEPNQENHFVEAIIIVIIITIKIAIIIAIVIAIVTTYTWMKANNSKADKIPP